jgi:hypothetical protein
LLHLLPLLHLLALFYLPLLIHLLPLLTHLPLLFLLPLLIHLLPLLIYLLALLHLLALLQVLPVNLALLLNLTLLLHRPALNLRPILHRWTREGIRPRTLLLDLPRPETLATVLTLHGCRRLRRYRRQRATPQRALALSPTSIVTLRRRRWHHGGRTRLLLDRRP